MRSMPHAHAPCSCAGRAPQTSRPKFLHFFAPFLDDGAVLRRPRSHRLRNRLRALRVTVTLYRRHECRELVERSLGMCGRPLESNGEPRSGVASAMCARKGVRHLMQVGGLRGTDSGTSVTGAHLPNVQKPAGRVRAQDPVDVRVHRALALVACRLCLALAVAVATARFGAVTSVLLASTLAAAPARALC